MPHRIHLLFSVLLVTGAGCVAAGEDLATESAELAAGGISSLEPSANSGFCMLEPPPEGTRVGAPRFDALGTGVLRWTFDDSVPRDVREYIDDLWADIRPPLYRIMGPPPVDLTVTIRVATLPPGVGGTYSPGSDTMTISPHNLPEANPERFDMVFTHEAVHALQDAALDAGGWDSWVAEGLAVAATQITREAVADEREMIPTRNLGHLSANYDSISDMDGAALAGSRYFTTNMWSLPYVFTAAGGFFWTLSSTQSGAAPYDWDGHDWLHRFYDRLYEAGRRLSTADALATIDDTAENTIDGSDAGTWARAQPITDVEGAPGRHLFAAVVSGGFLIGNESYLHDPRILFQVIDRSYTGGRATPLFTGQTHVRVWDWNGEVVYERDHDLSEGIGSLWGMQFERPLDYYPEPGAYLAEIDASAVGAGVRRLSFQVVPHELRGHEVGKGIAVTFTDADGALVDPEYTLIDAYPLLEQRSSYAFAPRAATRDVRRITIRADIDAAPVTRDVSILQPFRRVLRIHH